MDKGTEVQDGVEGKESENGSKNPSNKAELDSDGIDIDVSEPDKAVLDTDGIDVRDSDPDKAVLDTEGITNGSTSDKAALDADDIFEGLEEIDLDDVEIPDAKQEKKQPEQSRLPDQDDTEGRKISYKKITGASWFKYASITLGTVTLFLAVWTFAGYYFSHGNEDVKETQKKPPVVMFEPPEPELVVASIQLKPFLVSLRDEKSGSGFMQFKVTLDFMDIYEDTVKNSLKKIRLAVYMLMKKKNVDDITNIRSRDRIITELKNSINKVLNNGRVTDLSLTDILII